MSISIYLLESLRVQTKIGRWVDNTFDLKRGFDFYRSVEGMLEHLQKEVMELRNTVFGRATTDLVAEEAADCVILLLCIAHKYGFNLMEEVEKKFEVLKTRKWGDPDEKSVIEHIREE